MVCICQLASWWLLGGDWWEAGDQPWMQLLWGSGSHAYVWPLKVRSNRCSLVVLHQSNISENNQCIQLPSVSFLSAEICSTLFWLPYVTYYIKSAGNTVLYTLSIDTNLFN